MKIFRTVLIFALLITLIVAAVTLSSCGGDTTEADTDGSANVTGSVLQTEAVTGTGAESAPGTESGDESKGPTGSTQDSDPAQGTETSDGYTKLY